MIGRDLLVPLGLTRTTVAQGHHSIRVASGERVSHFSEDHLLLLLHSPIHDMGLGGVDVEGESGVDEREVVGEEGGEW